jgi:transcriptional regulator with XRE-family HTH domain
MNVREIREKLGLTQAQLAEKLGASQNYLYMIESGRRQLSKLLCMKLENLDNGFDNTCQNYAAINSNICNGDNNVIAPAQPPPDDLAIVPTETLTEHIEVVQQNNELLQEIREDQEKELRLKREQGRQLSEVLEFVQGLDEMMQKRVREIIDERTRTIIAATNHHIHTQAQVMITAIEGIINMVEAGVTNPDLFLRQLRAVRAQLEKMADFKQ